MNRHLDGALDGLDISDDSIARALAQLVSDCVEAKQMLSIVTNITIAIAVPGVPNTQLRITRTEFESMIRPALGETVTALRRAMQTSGVAPDDVAAVLLAGGCSRIPLVAEMVGSAFGRPVATDAHPKHAVALGAALSTPSAPRTRVKVLGDASGDVLVDRRSRHSP